MNEQALTPPTVSERIVTAVSPFVPVVRHGSYEGEQKEYIVYLMDSVPIFDADDEPLFIEHVAGVHWIFPKNVSGAVKKLQLAQALFNAGFTYPEISDRSDGTVSHLVFWVRYVEGA